MKIIPLILLVLTAISTRTLAQNTFPQNGDVGIRTISPTAALDVNGSVAIAGNSSNLDNRYGNLPLSFLENSGKVLVGWNRTRGAGETDFIANQGGGTVGGFAFYNHDNTGLETQLMWLTGDGRLMLGLTTGNIGNTGNNKLAVGGGIIAESVTVKVQAAWPDYVFRPAYRLPSLNSVKSYIDRNGHLPEMPSAAEVEKQGLNLGEMNRLLVKKVEELTLYLIDLKKDNESLTQRISKLENRK